MRWKISGAFASLEKTGRKKTYSIKYLSSFGGGSVPLTLLETLAVNSIL